MILREIKLTILLTPIGALEAVAIKTPLNKYGAFDVFLNLNILVQAKGLEL